MTEERLREIEDALKEDFTSSRSMAELIAEVRRLRGVNEAIGLLKGFVEVENQTLRNLLREARIHCANGFKDVPEKLDVLARIDALLGATDSQNVSREVEKGDR